MNISCNNTLKDIILHNNTDWRDLTNDDHMRGKFLEFVGDYNFFNSFDIKCPNACEDTDSSEIVHVRLEIASDLQFLPKMGCRCKPQRGVFGFPDTMADGMHFYHNVPDYEKQISKNMMVMWSNFAKTG